MRIIVTEEMARSKELNDEILLGSLPLDIQQAIIAKSTYIGNNPAIPNENYIKDIVIKEFKYSKKQMEKYDFVKFQDNEDLRNLLSKLIRQAQELEKPIKEQLEKICYKYVFELFNAPSDCIDFSMDLVDSINTQDSYIQIEPTPTNEYEFESSDDFNNLENEYKKRKIIVALNQGAALIYSDFLMKRIKEHEDIVSEDLLILYDKIITINRYLLFTKEDINITEKDPKLSGLVMTKFGNDEDKNIIESKGLVLPILITETIKGFMEMFSSHGLPKKRDVAEQVLLRTDYVKAEPWCMRIGPQMYINLLQQIDFPEPQYIPYIYMKISNLSIGRFNELMNHIFSFDNQAKKIVSPVIKKAMKENGDEFDDEENQYELIIDDVNEDNSFEN